MEVRIRTNQKHCLIAHLPNSQQSDAALWFEDSQAIHIREDLRTWNAVSMV